MWRIGHERKERHRNQRDQRQRRKRAAPAVREHQRRDDGHADGGAERRAGNPKRLNTRMLANREPAVGQCVAHRPQIPLGDAEQKSDEQIFRDAADARRQEQHGAPAERPGHGAAPWSEPIDKEAPAEDGDAVPDEEGRHQTAQLGVMSFDAQLRQERAISDDERDVRLVDLADDPQEQQGRRDEEPPPRHRNVPGRHRATTIASMI